jgi:hypothetical protein
MTTRRTPSQTALLILINAKLYENERGREITRYKFSISTLRRIAGRVALRDSFLSKLDDELAELGWLLIPLGTEYAVMDISKTESWVKLSGKRLSDEEYLDLDDEELLKIYTDLFPPEDEAADE